MHRVATNDNRSPHPAPRSNENDPSVPLSGWEPSWPRSARTRALAVHGPSTEVSEPAAPQSSPCRDESGDKLSFSRSRRAVRGRSKAPTAETPRVPALARLLL
jgi:hypothetical protein